MSAPDFDETLDYVQSVADEMHAESKSVRPARDAEGEDALRRIAADLLACAESWEPDVCLLGNVRAREIASLCRAALASRPADAGRGETDGDRSALRYAREDEGSSAPDSLVRKLCRLYGAATSNGVAPGRVRALTREFVTTADTLRAALTSRPTGEGAGPHPTEDR